MVDAEVCEHPKTYSSGQERSLWRVCLMCGALWMDEDLREVCEPAPESAREARAVLRAIAGR